jgi:hypothetical protein
MKMRHIRTLLSQYIESKIFKDHPMLPFAIRLSLNFVKGKKQLSTYTKAPK